ncbi:MAG: hypothetical protein GY845_11400 [Planctomycetes bacterium]|nr:hypothetical protein [Planctomycetota bacterium]
MGKHRVRLIAAGASCLMSLDGRKWRSAPGYWDERNLDTDFYEINSSGNRVKIGEYYDPEK